MSRRHLIDPEVAVPLDGLLAALPGGVNAVPDIVQRRATVEDPTATKLCDEVGAVVVSVEYRLSRNTRTPPRSRTATRACSGPPPMSPSWASARTGWRSTAAAPAAARPSPPR